MNVNRKGPSEEEIDDLLNKILEITSHEGTRFQGMSYEQGVEDAIEWMRDKEYGAPGDGFNQ